MIKENRIKNNYTQERLSEILGISTRQLQRIEKNEAETRIKTLKKIIDVLKIPDDEIIEYFHREQREIYVNRGCDLGRFCFANRNLILKYLY